MILALALGALPASPEACVTGFAGYAKEYAVRNFGGCLSLLSADCADAKSASCDGRRLEVIGMRERTVWQTTTEQLGEDEMCLKVVGIYGEEAANTLLCRGIAGPSTFNIEREPDLAEAVTSPLEFVYACRLGPASPQPYDRARVTFAGSQVPTGTCGWSVVIETRLKRTTPVDLRFELNLRPIGPPRE